ncbi:MAG: hypothetical protein KC613_25510, partial [Myxococcales bacterium]|nr:hypothetical protein [Myxococcales bacterium]
MRGRALAACLALLGLWAGLAHGREPPPVRGWLTQVDGVRVLYAWGTPRDRGFAHGVLLRDAIIEVVDQYAVARIGAGPYGVARALVGGTATVSPALRAEAEGLVAGLREAGGAQIPRLGRALDATDVLVLQAYTELAAVGCSSVSVWGAHSADGQARLVRNLDWSDAPALLRNQVVFVWAGEGMAQPLVSVGFAGYLGCLSCVSAAGTGAFFNMGYGQGAARPWGLLKGFTPANLLLREALAQGDVDGDGDV